MPPAVLVTEPPDGAAIVRAGLLTLARRGRRPGAIDTTVLRREAVRLEPRRVDAYARACGFEGSQGIPLTYPHNLAFPLHMMALLRPSFPYPVVGLVHLDNEVRQHGRLDSADVLDVEVALGRWLAHARGQAVTVETRISRHGEPVWDSTSTYLRVGVRAPAGEPYVGLQADPERLVTAKRWVVPADQGRRFARVSGDANPIHTARWAARLFGFRRPIAHGMWSKARVLAELLPKRPVERARARVVFRTPVLLPGAITLLVGRRPAGALFELRDRTETRPHLRGQLVC